MTCTPGRTAGTRLTRSVPPARATVPSPRHPRGCRRARRRQRWLPASRTRILSVPVPASRTIVRGILQPHPCSGEKSMFLSVPPVMSTTGPGIASRPPPWRAGWWPPSRCRNGRPSTSRNISSRCSTPGNSARPSARPSAGTPYRSSARPAHRRFCLLCAPGSSGGREDDLRPRPRREPALPAFSPAMRRPARPGSARAREEERRALVSRGKVPLPWIVQVEDGLLLRALLLEDHLLVRHVVGHPGVLVQVIGKDDGERGHGGPEHAPSLQVAKLPRGELQHDGRAGGQLVEERQRGDGDVSAQPGAGVTRGRGRRRSPTRWWICPWSRSRREWGCALARRKPRGPSPPALRARARPAETAR